MPINGANLPSSSVDSIDTEEPDPLSIRIWSSKGVLRDHSLSCQ
jgi:hypothetical protein